MMLFSKFKCLCKFTLHIIQIKRYRWSSENAKVFTESFDLSYEESKRYRYVHKIPPLNSEHIVASAELCDKLNISKKDFLQYPTLVKESPLHLEENFLYLKEGGFVNIDAKVLLSFRRCSNKSVRLLKALNLIPENINVAQSFVKYLNPKPPNIKIDDLDDEQIFGAIHHTILTRYLMWLFDVDEDRIEKFYRTYTIKYVKSFTYLCDNYSIVKQLGFTSDKIMKSGYVLSVYPQHTRAVLNELSRIIDVNIMKVMKVHPKLIGIPLKQFKAIYECLKTAQISDDAIKINPNIFNTSLKTIKARLDEIRHLPELNILSNHPHILKLIIYHNEVRSRLSFLQQIKLKCCTPALLCSNGTQFTSHIREGRDINSINEVISFVKYLLKSKNSQIEMNLKKHKYWRYVPLIEIKDSYRFLRHLRFKNAALVNVTQVLLYPSYKLNSAYNEVGKYADKFERRITDAEKLNLMLYYIEKEHHFTGNGIWREDKRPNVK